MKRIVTILAFACFALGAGAQDTYWAQLLSRNNYYGTARSIALGNAMTALGGDLGSVGINPAGSAVNSFGQFTITPAMLFQSTAVSWSSSGDVNFDAPSTTSHSKFNLPNVGATMVLYTGNNYGLKHITLGFVLNNTDTYLNYTSARGSNPYTSLLGDIAGNAYGLEYADMSRSQKAAYCANQIGEFGPEGSLRYSGANQMVDKDDMYAYLPGTLDQWAESKTYGTKKDFITNIGFNISDNFYFGFNLGIPTSKYRNEEFFQESAQAPVQFPVNFVDDDGKHLGVEGEPTTYYKSSTNGYKLNSDVSGIYGKFGLIWLPTKSLRVGAAIQTPTFMTIEESWQYTASTTYENSKYNGSAKSDVGSASYRLRTSYEVNAGVAYTFGGFGLLSVDYEMMDYSVMKFSDLENDYFSDDTWAETNLCNKLFYGVSHSVRAGLEVKPLPELTVRAGYSLVTSPERYALDLDGYEVSPENWQGASQLLSDFHYYKGHNIHAFSLGLGYSSPGSFFADATVRLTKYPVEYFVPYFFPDYEVLTSTGSPANVAMPYEKFEKSIVDAVVTFGWRF